MLKVPNNSISKFKSKPFKNWIKINIKRVNFSFIHKISYLPNYTSIFSNFFS